MGFLGDLGIDIKLLIAQIINFGVLLWLLTKFLYKPIVNRIEKDETELKQAQIQKKKFDQERDAFIELKKKELDDAKKLSQKIIKEAEYISAKIKKEIHNKTKKEAQEIIAQSRNTLKSLRPDIEKEIFNRTKVEIGSSFKKSFGRSLSLSSQEKFQNVFWEDLVEQTKNLTLKRLKEPSLAEVMKKFDLTVKESNKKKHTLNKELEKTFVRKIGPIVLEYVYPLTTEQENTLKEIILKKIGISLNIVKKQNKDLINGFRFEIAGIIIESNLLNIINDATNFKK